jgi:hypothetical protein
MTVYYQKYDFNHIPIEGVVIHSGATAPASPVVDQLWTDTGSSPHLLKKYDGSTWVAVGFVPDDSITDAKVNSAAAIALSKLATNPLARANHTGTQTASTISDFDTAVRTSRLDQLAAPTADVSANGHKVTNVATASAAGDAVNLGDLQAALAAADIGFKGVKTPVRVATAPGFDVTNPGAAIDGVTMAQDDRFLVPDDGIYVYNGAGNAATAAPDGADAEVSDGTFVAVGEGTKAGYIYVQQEADVAGNGQDWVVFKLGGLTYTVNAPLTIAGTAISLPNLAVADGGTGATDAATARTNLSAAGAYGETVTAGDFVIGQEVTVTHGLGTVYINAGFTDDTTGGNAGFDWRVIDANSIGVTSYGTVTNDINVAVFGAQV